MSSDPPPETSDAADIADSLTDWQVDPFEGPDWAGKQRGVPRPTTGRTGGEWVKVSRKKKRKRRLRRRIAFAVLGGLIVLAGIYLAVTGLLARSQLEQVRADVSKLRAEISAGDLTGARATAKVLAAHAHRAHQLTSGPVWAGVSHLPGSGPVDTVRKVSAGIDVVGSDALPHLVNAVDVVDPSHLRAADGTIDLAKISAAVPDLNQASAAMTAATQQVAGSPAHTWVGAIDSARASLLSQLTSLSHTADGAAIAARVAPAMLGQDGPKNYMVSFETEAELRGTGGLPGAFAILHADNGKLSFSRFESDGTLTGVRSGVDLGTDFNRLYTGSNAPEEYADSNVSPHFPYAARIWTAMWRDYSGQQLDGAFALDPTALSYLLAVTGPAELPDHTSVTAANVVALTQKDVYAKYTNPTIRKQRQLAIARAIGQHVIAGHPNTTALLRAAGRAAGERRLLGWSSDPAVEADLARTALGGTVPETNAPFIGLAINNAAANKLDYYLGAKVRWQRSGCGPTRDVTVTITLTSHVPNNLPTYVYGETGRPQRPQRRGDNEDLIGYYPTSGAVMKSVTLDGKPFGAQLGFERGHLVMTVDLLVAQGSTHTIVYHLEEPAGTGSPVVMPQPMVQPLQVQIENNTCG